MINWPQFLTNNHIEYVTSGPNTARNNISINCPYCSDPSHHLGISLEGKGWSCWRCNNHGGSVKLIQKLIHCDYEEAQRIAGVQTTITVSDVTLTSYIKGLMTKEPQIQNTRILVFPEEIRPLIKESKYTPHSFMAYIRSRGFSPKKAFELANIYELRYALTGPFAYRIVFPIYDINNNLVTWTGRIIGGKTIVRYKTLSNDAEKAKAEGTPQAIESIKDCLWNYPALVRGIYHTLILTEGPFDALKLDYFGTPSGVRSTCLFGKSISEAQINWLSSISLWLNHVYICLDSDSELDMARIAQKLSHLNCKIKGLPKGIKDPATMTKQQIEEWI